MYIVSDLHLGHENIIEYCNRPHYDIHNMNYDIVTKWNNTVNEKDVVLFLGDLHLSDTPTEHWINMLNGQIIFVKGNHDDFGMDSFNIGDVLFSHRPEEYDGWNVHGHTHNNTPFIDYDKKRVNVSVEHTNYTPIPISEIYTLMGV